MNYGESTINYQGAHFGPKLNLVPITISNSLVSTTKDKDASKEDLTPDVDRLLLLFSIEDTRIKFTNAKPIIDKYGFKASFFVICSFVNGDGYYKLSNGSELAHKGDNAMEWDQIRQLHEEGRDIESHGMEHRDLRLLTSEQLEHEIAESKRCLQDYGLEPTFFQIPNNRGADNTTVLKMVSNYFDFGLSGHSRHVPKL